MPVTKSKTRKVIAKTVKVNRKPRKPTGKIITLSQYGTDLKRRLDIHNYEFYMFIEDIKKGINAIIPYVESIQTQYKRFVK
tara:strand:- start:19379 stop:19621 length:243 start_codon:yes stop_codon:yes gene_type:complete